MASLNETSQLSSTTCSNDSFVILSAQQLRHLENATCRYLEEDGTAGCLNPSVFGAEGVRSIGDMLEDALGVDYNGDIGNDHFSFLEVTFFTWRLSHSSTLLIGETEPAALSFNGQSDAK
jgi:hypothetical protein